MCAEFGAIVISSPSISIATSVWNCVEDCAVSVLSNADVSCCQMQTCLVVKRGRVFFGRPCNHVGMASRLVIDLR